MATDMIAHFGGHRAGHRLLRTSRDKGSRFGIMRLGFGKLRISRKRGKDKGERKENEGGKIS